jgi:hypothetical protein
MLNTRIGENYNANDIINANDLRKRLLNIDSRFRTNLGESSSNFFYRLPHTYRNVIRIRVASIEIPNSYYVFTAKKGNTSFTVITSDICGIMRTLHVKIPDGNYAITELIDTIQMQFDEGFRDPYGIFLSITLDLNTAKVTITHNGLSEYPVCVSPCDDNPPQPKHPANPLTVCFAPEGTSQPAERNCGLGLGYNLGFRNRVYKVSRGVPRDLIDIYTLTGEACADVVGDNYMFLAINDLHAVEHKTGENYLQVLAKIIVREDKNAIIYDDGSTLLSNEVIFPSPVDLSTLQVSLIDPYQSIIDLNGLNFSATLEITEVMNTKLYDFYRNYIWLGTLPSVPYKTVEGSASGLLRGRGP